MDWLCDNILPSQIIKINSKTCRSFYYITKYNNVSFDRKPDGNSTIENSKCIVGAYT